MLVLMPGNEARREILFVKERNPEQEHWTGRVLTTDEARAQTGIETVLSSTQFEPFVAGDADAPRVWRRQRQKAARFFDALAAGRGRVALLLDPIAASTIR